IPPEDDVFLAEEQPLHTATSPTAESPGMGARRPMQVARECTYPDFLKCQPLNFKGTEGVC
ncbi:hypothetical protein Tco_1021784, partial [Tanacetum coccineum]